MSHIYNIHNVLSIKSDADLNIRASEQEREAETYDLIVRQVERKPVMKNGYRRISEGLYYSKTDDEIFSNIDIFGFNIYWGIQNLLGETTELVFNKAYRRFVNHIRFPVSSIHRLHPLIKMVMQIKLLQKQRSFLIGASVSINGRGIIFTGASAAGKTTTVMNVVKHLGAMFHSDDMSLITARGIFNYPSNLYLRKYPKGIFSFKGIMDPEIHFNGRITTSIPKDCHIFFLEQSVEKQIREICFLEGVEKACNINNKMFLYFSERILSSIPYVYNDLSLLSLQNLQKDVLSTHLKDARFFILSAETPNDYIDLLKSRYINLPEKVAY